MPLYEFRCQDCGLVCDQFARHDNIPVVVDCEGCIGGAATRIFSTPMVPIIDNVIAKTGRKRRKNAGEDLLRGHQADSAALARAIR